MNGPAAYSSVSVGARSAYPAAVIAVRCSSSSVFAGGEPAEQVELPAQVPVSSGCSNTRSGPRRTG